jgi:transcriptional regulator with XRE-family HTH domain
MTGPELLAWRRRLGLTQTEAARGLAVGKQTLWQWESGRRKISPAMALLMRYVEAFGPMPEAKTAGLTTEINPATGHNYDCHCMVCDFDRNNPVDDVTTKEAV